MIETPAIVRPLEETVQKTAREWHEQALEADRSRSNSSLLHAQALYELQDKYAELGYESFGEYVFENFGKSLAWAKKLIQIHLKFVVTLGRDQQELLDIGFGKLSKLASVVDTDNADEILEKAKNMSQQEIDHKIKEAKGLAVNETQTSDDKSTLKFSGPKEAMEVVKVALDLAALEYVHGTDRDPDKLIPFQGLEILAASYLVSNSLDGPEENLAKLIKDLERIHSIKISYEKVANE